MPSGDIGGGFKPRQTFNDDPSSSMDVMMLENLGYRMRYAELVAPKAVLDPSAMQGITSLAMTSQSDDEFEQSVQEMYGFNEAGSTAASLAEMPEDIAYIRFHELPPEMQAAVERQGFTPRGYGTRRLPGDGKRSGLFGSVPLIGGIAQRATGFVSEEILSEVGGAFNEMAQGVNQGYRTVEQMAEWSQEDGAGLGNIAPRKWMNAWSAVENGSTWLLEDDRETVKQDYGLTDPELDTYLALSQGKLPGEIAEQEGLEIGTQEHTDRVAELYTMATDPLGQELVGAPLDGSDGVLNNYRISFGRRIARDVGFEPSELDNGWGKAVSGGMDAAWAVFMDPTLIGGKALKSVRLARGARMMALGTDAALDAATVARGVRELGWAVEARKGVPGLRNVLVHTADGPIEMAASRLKYGERVDRGLEMVSKTFRADAMSDAEFVQTFQAMPNLFDAYRPLARASAEWGDEGFAKIENLTEFLRTPEGYKVLGGTTLGGRNTSEFLRLPEVGKTRYATIKAKGLADKAMDWAEGVDARLAEEIGTAPGRAGQILKGSIGHPIKFAQRAAVAPLQFGRLLTTHVPRRMFIGLADDTSLAEFERFLQMGRRVGMTSDETARYFRDFAGRNLLDEADDGIHGLLGQNAAVRATVVRGFTVDLLERLNLGDNDELYKRFIGKIDEAYGLTPEGEIMPGRAVLAQQQAMGIAIPSFRDMIQASNRYSVTRSLFGRGGFLNPQLVDTTLTRYWKPSVLMRVGFIGRAAGEELLAYLARYGSRAYIGTTLAQDVAKKQLFDEIIGKTDDVMTRERVIDMLNRTPDQWQEAIARAGYKGQAPSPYEVLTWGESQALTPFTASIHTLDTFWRRMALGKYEIDPASAPAWRRRIGDRIQNLDATAIRSSIRTAQATSQARQAINRGIQKAPGLHRAAQMLDGVLDPWLLRWKQDPGTFMQIAESAGIPSKQQFAKLIAGITDDDIARLRDVITDPVIRRAVVENVTGGGLYNVGMELESRSDAQIVLRYNPRTKETTQHLMVPEGNKTVVIDRPDGEMDMQQIVDYHSRYVQNLNMLWDERLGLDEAIIRGLTPHFTPSMTANIASNTKAAGLVSLVDPSDLGQTRLLAHEIKSLRLDHQQILLEAIEDHDLHRVALDLAAEITGEGVEAENARRALRALSGVTDEATQSALLNPRLVPDQVHDSFERAVEELSIEVQRVMGRPAAAREAQAWEGYAHGLTRPPLEDHTPMYVLATDGQTNTWATQHLNKALDPDTYEAFVEDMTHRLAALNLPEEYATVIADELFDPNAPMSLVTDLFKQSNRTSFPVSMLASSDNQLMDEVMNALDSVTNRRFHLQRIDMPNSQLSSDLRAGGRQSLDGNPDWQQSILWRSQVQDFSAAMPLENGSRKVLVEAPKVSGPRTWDTEHGPPLPSLRSSVTPESTTWSMATTDDLGISDIIPELPQPEAGMRRIYGHRALSGDEISWTKADVDEIMNGLPDDTLDWYFADIPEDEWVGMSDLPLSDEVERFADPKHFATEGETITSVGPDGSVENGWHARPVDFEYTNLAESQQWRGAFSPQHFVAEHEDTLRRLAMADTQPFVADEITDEVRAVAERMGFQVEDLTDPGMGIVRQAIGNLADDMLIKGRQAKMLPARAWVDQDELERIAAALGGPIDVKAADQIFDQALAQATDEDMVARLQAAKATGGDISEEAVAVRNAAVADLDVLIPNWRGAEGWARPGTGEWFGLDDVIEPTILPGSGRRVYTTGVSPGQKSNAIVNDQVEQIVRHFTNARSGSLADQRVLHEILNPLSVGGRKRIAADLPQRVSVHELPLKTGGQKYVDQTTFAWDRLTNFFFDDVASKAIGSIVRNQLFATNYLAASKLMDPLADMLQDPALREAVAPIMRKLGDDLTIDDLDEMVDLSRHGMFEMPSPERAEWDEILDTGETISHQSHVDSWSNSVLRVPGPKMSVSDANDYIRKQLDLADTPAHQAVRQARRQVDDEILAKEKAVWDRELNLGRSKEEAAAAVREWRNANLERMHEIRDQAGARAKEEMRAARAKGEQMGTDVSDLEAWDEIVTDLSGPEIAQLRRYVNMRTNALDTTRDASVQRAFQGTIPYIDDHRIRSQFQEYVGNIVPFWFAEEQFLKRWTRIMKETPEAFRKGQLLMHGLRTVGFIKTDMEGNEYFVYPGSAAATSFLSETPVAKLIFGSETTLPVGMALTGDVKHTLPGFGDQMGVPSAGPFVGIGLEMLASRSPEWAAVQESVMGERGSNRSLTSFLVPTSVKRFYDAFTLDVDEREMASAMIQTAQLMEASGHGLPEGATPAEQQEYLHKLEGNARSILLTRAMFGFMMPASPQISPELPLAEEFQALIQSGMPYTEALAVFAEQHDGDISPYTVFKSEVPSNAPMAATQDALLAMDAYEDQLRMFPMAGPWLLLPFRTNDDEFDNRAYRWQLQHGLRKYRSPAEYVNALAWADASPTYFDTIEDYDAQIEGLRLAGLDDLVRQKEAERAAWVASYKNANPLFADKLSSSDGRTERQQILREAYQLINYPGAEDIETMGPMRELLERYRTYDDQLTGLNMSRSKASVALKESLTMEFQSFIGLHLMAHPDLRYFYDRVLRPELGWDTQENGGI